jgi:hypothetical protein
LASSYTYDPLRSISIRRAKLALESHSNRGPAVRFPVDPGSAASPHPGQAKRPSHAYALAMDLSSNGPRIIGDSERPCGHESGSRYPTRALGMLPHK